jgi:hypothetical protein
LGKVIRLGDTRSYNNPISYSVIKAWSGVWGFLLPFFGGLKMSKSDKIQAHTDRYQLIGALDPDTDEINPVRVGDTTVLGMATQLYVWNTSTLVWDKMTQPSISADTINVEATPDTSDLSTKNSTVAQLGISAVYTGTGEDMLGYAQVGITIHSDVSSTDGGMQFQWSMDDTNWDDSYDFHLDHNNSTTRRFQFPVCARYFRVKYTNGGTETAQFRIQTILHRGNILTSIHAVGDEVIHDRSCQLMKSVIVGETTAGGGGYVNVKVNPSGALTVEEGSAEDILIMITDNLQNYFFSGYVVDGTAVYLGYEDKDGVYYVQYIETSTGVVTYAVGTGGIVVPGSYSGLSYDSFASKF